MCECVCTIYILIMHAEIAKLQLFAGVFHTFLHCDSPYTVHHSFSLYTHFSLSLSHTFSHFFLSFLLFSLHGGKIWLTTTALSSLSPPPLCLLSLSLLLSLPPPLSVSSPFPYYFLCLLSLYLLSLPPPLSIPPISASSLFTYYFLCPLFHSSFCSHFLLIKEKHDLTKEKKQNKQFFWKNLFL